MRCKNCEKDTLEADDFCKSCGAKVIRNRLTLRNLWDDFTEQFLNYDNKFLKTYLTLFRNPQQVIGSFINGTRKKYVNVVSYFAIALTLAGFQLFILLKFYPEALDISKILPEQAAQNTSDMSWVYEYYSFIALVNLPIYALIGKISFIGLKKYNYTEHLVITTYSISQFSITNAFLLTFIIIAFGGNFYIWGNVMNLLLMIYVAITYKKLYPLTNIQIILRTLMFFGVLLALLIISSVIQFGILYFNGGLEEMIEAEKAKRAVSYIASSIMNWTS